MLHFGNRDMVRIAYITKEKQWCRASTGRYNVGPIAKLTDSFSYLCQYEQWFNNVALPTVNSRHGDKWLQLQLRSWSRIEWQLYLPPNLGLTITVKCTINSVTSQVQLYVKSLPKLSSCHLMVCRWSLRNIDFSRSAVVYARAGNRVYFSAVATLPTLRTC